jgi:murein DD-endopeptidase MepM/ murein hydrolase activator NlpD
MTRRALGRRGRPDLGRRAIGRIGQRGWDVAAMQFLLGLHGFPSGSIDGGFGERTRSALLRFQGWAGLTIDGVAGPATFSALRRPPARSPLRFLRPIDAPLTDGFRPRGDRMHTGQDFPALTGTPVRAAGYGCVLTAGDIGGYGTTVIIGHRMGMSSLYAHLSAVHVREGQCVRAGAHIGDVGATGIVTGPHLHFELRLRDAAIDPFGAY